MASRYHYDVLAERSKALRSGRSLARGVGSNPTDVIFGAPAAAPASRDADSTHINKTLHRPANRTPRQKAHHHYTLYRPANRNTQTVRTSSQHAIPTSTPQRATFPSTWTHTCSTVRGHLSVYLSVRLHTLSVALSRQYAHARCADHSAKGGGARA